MNSDDPISEAVPAWLPESLMVPFALGQFVIQWGRLERTIALLIASLERYPNLPLSDEQYFEVRDELLDGQISSFSKRLQRVAKQDRFLGLCNELEKVVNGFDETSELRKSLYHGVWSGLDEHHNHVFKEKRRGKNQRISKFDAEAVFQMVMEVQSVGANSLIVEIGLKRAAKLGLRTIQFDQWNEIIVDLKA